MTKNKIAHKKQETKKRRRHQHQVVNQIILLIVWIRDFFALRFFFSYSNKIYFYLCDFNINMPLNILKLLFQ